MTISLPRPSLLVSFASVLLTVLSSTTVQGAEVVWDNSVGDNNFLEPSNWVGNSFPASESMVVDLTATNRAVLSSGTSESCDAVLIGYNGSDGEFAQTGGALNAASNPSAVSRAGRNGETGTWLMSGGRASVNAIQLGLGNGTGTMNISGGNMNIARGVSGYSLIVDNGGTGNFEISGGSLLTRSGVKVGDQGTFSVIGHGATAIGIGSSGSVDGEWYQEGGGVLKVRVNATSTGLTPIFIDEVETSDGSAGNVTFENGALLDVGFTGAFVNGGTFTVMEWEGTVTNPGGLAFAPGVDTSVWSFNLDEVNKKLTVTAAGAPFVDTTVTVNSISELRQYAGEDNFTVTMTPGTYWMDGPPASPAPSGSEQWTFLNLSGSNSSFDLTGVTIKVDTQELSYYGGVGVRVFHVSGNDTVVDGLNLQMENLTLAGVDEFGNPKQWTAGRSSVVAQVTGSNTIIRNCDFTTGGSYPYGYGDAFGKGARPNVDGVTSAAFISHSKQSGFLITNGASNVLVENVTLNMRSYGHGFFMQGGASDITFTDCQALGDTMADSDDIIAHPRYQEWGAATYNVPIPADINISKHEGGFRVYGNSDYETNGYPEFIENITISNCRVERMRVGVACADAIGFLRVSDTEILGCEYGFAPSGYGTETTYVRCKGDAVNGPLIYFQRSVDYPANMEIELTGSTPGKGVWPIALISGNGSNITLTSSASPGVYPDGAYINLSQKWREWRHRPAGDLDEQGSGNYSEATTNTTVNNHTGQALLIGPNATDNDCVSDGGIINKSSGNTYVGTTLVPPNITIQDTWTSPANPLDVSWAQFDSGGTQILPTAPHTIFNGLHFVDDLDDVGGSFGDGSSIEVQDGGTLELDGGMQLQGGTVTLEGSGTAGQGAAYSDGQSGTGTRLGSNSTSITKLAGDATIGVGVAGNQLLIGPIEGTGSLIKVGPGKLSMEQFINNTFSGSLIVSEGEVQTRSGKARNDLVIAAGATFSQIGNLGLNQDSDEVTLLDGTLNINSRDVTDVNPYSVNIGTLSGASTGVITATSASAIHTVNVSSDTTDGEFSGEIQGTVALVKSGTSTLILAGNNSHGGGTTVNAGVLTVNGSLPVTSDVAVNSGGTLGGSGTVNSSITLASGSSIAPGNSVGTLTTADQTWMAGATLEIEMTDATGSPGSGWDLLDLNGTLNLDAGVTSENPIHIVLSGAATNFDMNQNASWLIVDAQGIVGTFSADRFTIDASAIVANHPVEGGYFSISQSANNLFLDFTAAPHTALENWRIANFGSVANSGDGADDFDYDADGRVNLLEYAVGSDPKVHSPGPMLELGTTLDGARLTLTFLRIADPALIYTVTGSNTLDPLTWIPVWTSAGLSNTNGPVVVSDTELISDHSRRFLRLEVGY